MCVHLADASDLEVHFAAIDWRPADLRDERRALLRDVLVNKLYKHYRVVRMANKATRFLKSLFMVYCGNPEQLPPYNQEKVKEMGKHRAICDYIAGMTDRYALDQYKKFFEPYERV